MKLLLFHRVPFQRISAFQASVNVDGLIVTTLERSDLQENVTAYAAQLSGEPRLIRAQFVNTSEPLLFNTSFHGVCYTVGLLLRQGQSWSRPVRTLSMLTSKNLQAHRDNDQQSTCTVCQIMINIERLAQYFINALISPPLKPLKNHNPLIYPFQLTFVLLCFVPSEPLPVHTVHIWDYKESPETGVVFEIESPAGNVFSRVNISYTEGQERRTMLYKGTRPPRHSLSDHQNAKSNPEHLWKFTVKK